MAPYAFRFAAVALALVLLAPAPTWTQPDPEVKAFNDRVQWYVQIHRDMEGPVPAIETAADMDEVQRLMRAVRVRILAKTGQMRRGHVFTPGLTQMIRRHVAAVLSREDLNILLADVVEHSPPKMPALRLQQPLPEDAPFVAFPPRLFTRLPPLPVELRYLVLEKALVLWDHHADMVVDMARGVFDPATYPATGARP